MSRRKEKMMPAETAPVPAPEEPAVEREPLIPTAQSAGLALPPEKRYAVRPAPHVTAEEDTRSIMLDVLIALMPSLCLSVYYFGWRALMLTLESAALCVAFEWLWCRLRKLPQSAGDLSAVVTGVLLSFTLPATVPYYLPVVACAFAILIVKQLYGGIGRNLVNPALAGRVFVFFCFTGAMTRFPEVFSRLPVLGPVDAVTAATPLASLKAGVLPDLLTSKLFIGQHAGALGETGTVTLLAGGAYLMLRRVISPRIPLCYLGTVALLCLLFPRGEADRVQWMLSNLCSGGLVLGAFFMATDYATSPVTGKGRMLYGAGCGALTVLFRYFGSYAEGVAFAILLMNLCSPLFDKTGVPRRYGVPRRRRKGADGQ